MSKKQPPYFDYHTDVEVEVSISPDDLKRDGWHHETECGNKELPPGPLVIGELRLDDALNALHEQAHPGESRWIQFCRQEPCCSLSWAVLRGEVPAA